MAIKRKVENMYAPPAHSGFLGKGHIARPVIQIEFPQSDPFIMLMDDMLDKKDEVPVGGPHPHAGFETVTLMIEGVMGEEPHLMKAGDFEMMTAGSGVVHTEVISKKTKMRLLQLWLNLPKNQRQASPRIQRMEAAHVPQGLVGDSTVRVYSGSFAKLTSPIRNYTPVIIADIDMKANATLAELIPANFTTFIYVLSGTLLIGEEQATVPANHVAWLDRYEEGDASELLLKAGGEGARFVLYSGHPQNHDIVSHGPFIADSMEAIKDLYANFRHGKMEHISDVSEEQKLVY
jgi:redox-sensitive bicupin YhaK (pirin superfamily)